MNDGTTEIVSQRSLIGGPQFRFHEQYLEYFGLDWDFRTRYEHISGPSGYRRQKTSDRLTTLVFAYLCLLFLAILLRDQHPQYGPKLGARLVDCSPGLSGPSSRPGSCYIT